MNGATSSVMVFGLPLLGASLGVMAMLMGAPAVTCVALWGAAGTMAALGARDASPRLRRWLAPRTPCPCCGRKGLVRVSTDEAQAPFEPHKAKLLAYEPAEAQEAVYAGLEAALAAARQGQGQAPAVACLSSDVCDLCGYERHTLALGESVVSRHWRPGARRAGQKVPQDLTRLLAARSLPGA